MKTHAHSSNRSRRSGTLLLECLVYIAVFAILLSVGVLAFNRCWDYSKALRYATNDVESALRAGECWRADVRAASGKIAVQKTADGETVQLIEPNQTVVYRFANGELRREIPAQNISRLLLAKVKTSQMQLDARGNVTAWRWEIELIERRPQMRLPLLFTFEAVSNQL